MVQQGMDAAIHQAESESNNKLAPPQALIRVEQLRKTFSVGSHFQSLSLKFTGPDNLVRAVNDISFSIAPGEILGLAGESGCGKSTTGELLVRLQEPTGGRILIDNQDIAQMKGKDLKTFRRHVQMIFQDPYESLNPRFTVFDTVAEALRVHKVGSKRDQLKRVIEALEEAEFRPAAEYLSRFPHELSGGQRQRLAIARAMVLKPKFVVADEPVSMLDVSVRAGVLNLLKRLQVELGLTMLYISHDLSTVKYLTQRMATMYLGNIVEIAPTNTMPKEALHPYTRALFAAVPIATPRIERPPVPIIGDLSKSDDNNAGCIFANRCPNVLDTCRHTKPKLRAYKGIHSVACHLYHDQQGNPLFPPLKGGTVTKAHSSNY